MGIADGPSDTVRAHNEQRRYTSAGADDSAAVKHWEGRTFARTMPMCTSDAVWEHRMYAPPHTLAMATFPSSKSRMRNSSSPEPSSADRAALQYSAQMLLEIAAHTFS